MTHYQTRHEMYEKLRQRAHEEVPKLIRLGREGSHWDFKQEWHADKVSLQHDIICLANNLESEVSYLIIGIADDCSAIIGVDDAESKRLNTQNIVNMLGNMRWGNSRAPFVLVESIKYSGKTLDVVVILSMREDMPYFLAMPSGRIKPSAIHSRRNDQNTPIDKGATWSEIEDIWRHHFGLDESPLIRVEGLLGDKDHWRDLTSLDSSEDKYYEFEPEFTVLHYADYERTGYEYYMLGQTDSTPGWYNIEVRYFQTVICSRLGVALDGGRYFTPAPPCSFFNWGERRRGILSDLTYCFFLANSIEWALNGFFFDESSPSAARARKLFLDNVVLYEDEDERRSFEDALRYHENTFTKRLQDQPDPYEIDRLPDYYSNEARESMSLSIRAVPVIKGMLQEYRDGTQEWWRDNTTTSW